MNSLNYSPIKLRLAGSFEAALIASTIVYASLLAVGFELRGGRLLQESGRDLGGSLRPT